MIGECSKCKRTNCMVPMDFPHQELGYKCMFCCFEIYSKLPDLAGPKLQKVRKHD